jgi:hypothetical protein
MGSDIFSVKLMKRLAMASLSWKLQWAFVNEATQDKIFSMNTFGSLCKFSIIFV